MQKSLLPAMLAMAAITIQAPTVSLTATPHDITANSASIAYDYQLSDDLQGVRVVNPQGGIFIRQCGQKTEKIFIK